MGSGLQPALELALRRARTAWLNAACINAGGRWGVVPALVVAAAGAVLVLAGVQQAWLLALLAALGLFGVAAALLITRAAFAKPGQPGAPDYVLALDRALQLDDALPVLLEAPGAFAAPLNARVCAALTPQALRAAAPPRHYTSLVVALILCLLPLAGLAPGAMPQTESEPEQTAQHLPDQPQPEGAAGSEAEAEDSAPGQGESTNEQAKGRDGSAGEGAQPQPQPAAGEAPEDMPKPEVAPESPRNPGGPGDEKGPPPQPPEAPEKEPESRDTKITPDAGEGETRKEKRSRWVYNPDGAPLDDASLNPPKVEGGDELAIRRQKLTGSERQRLQELFDKLYR